MIEIPSIEQELQYAEHWILGSQETESAPAIIRRLMMVIRFLLQDLREVQAMNYLEDGWSEK